jgi:hypothetical protein
VGKKKKKVTKKFGLLDFFADICNTIESNSYLILTTMADNSKKQLIYKDYSAVNTDGSPLNVDVTESINLLGGEIWYN